jgi:S-DNA-T family DNA segregation ATPase FtsK/SpoIIIE
VLRSLICALALTHTPAEAQFYCLDFGGGSLASLRDLPHVGGVAGRLDVNQVRRTVAEVRTLLDQRERTFAEHSVENVAAYRRAKAEGRFADDPTGDVFLVVDGWATVRNDYDGLDEDITDIANRGLNYGIHVVIAATRWFDLRQALSDVLGSKIELRLGDPTDSYLGRRAAMNVPEGSAGRGITPGGLHMLAALPRIDGVQDASDVQQGVSELVTRVRQHCAGPHAPRVRLLPDRVRYDEIAQPGKPHAYAIGLAERDLRPVTADFGADPHLLVFGDTESGKSTLLRSLATSITTACTPAQARIILVDFRRSLFGFAESGHVIGYGMSGPSAAAAITEAATAVRGRLPGPDVTAEQLRTRSWWSGPDLYVLVDDYDLLPSDNPLLPLLDLLPQARDIGLHVVVSRRSGGAGQALYEPFLSCLRDLGTPGVLLSGDRSEGELLPRARPMPLPPGRGVYANRRRTPDLVQLAWLEPDIGT